MHILKSRDRKCALSIRWYSGHVPGFTSKTATPRVYTKIDPIIHEIIFIQNPTFAISVYPILPVENTMAFGGVPKMKNVKIHVLFVTDGKHECETNSDNCW